MAKKREPNYALIFLGSLVLVLILHYFIISRFDLHPTLHVFISLMMFWMAMAFASLLPRKK